MKTMWPGGQNLFDDGDEILDVAYVLANTLGIVTRAGWQKKPEPVSI